jgi:3-(3-hydroxy-phenyl)propionate hydroxylase
MKATEDEAVVDARGTRRILTCTFAGRSARTLRFFITLVDIKFELGDGHPLLGRRMPDLDVVTTSGPRRVYSFLHRARPVLINFDAPYAIDITPWSGRVQYVHATYTDAWELPVLGRVTAPTAVLVRPDGYDAWVGEETPNRLTDALSKWHPYRSPS